MCRKKVGDEKNKHKTYIWILKEIDRGQKKEGYPVKIINRERESASSVEREIEKDKNDNRAIGNCPIDAKSCQSGEKSPNLVTLNRKCQGKTLIQIH